MRALYYVEDLPGEDEIEVKEFIIDNQWDREMLLSYVSLEMTEYIIGNIFSIFHNDKTDKAVWMGNNSGEFTVKTAWEIVRKRRLKKYSWKGSGIRSCDSS